MKVAIIGATGAVGREMIVELEESGLHDIELELYASPKSEGKTIPFLGKYITVKVYNKEKAGLNDFILMSAGGDFSKKNAKGLVEMGAVVIDNSSAWRSHDEVPLIVPEVNGDSVKGYKKGIIANPNCSTIQMVVPLKALDDAFGIEMVNVSTYQSVSGSGQQGMSELSEQTQAYLRFKEPQKNIYSQVISFNVLSSIGEIDAEGHCEEEEKMILETQKILEKKFPIFATTARVPVINCHCESLLVKLSNPTDLESAKNILSECEGVEYADSEDQSDHPSPINTVGENAIFVNRLRLPLGQNKSEWLQFWIVADNLKKGAATNAVQILQKII